MGRPVHRVQPVAIELNGWLTGRPVDQHLLIGGRVAKVPKLSRSHLNHHFYCQKTIIIFLDCKVILELISEETQRNRQEQLGENFSRPNPSDFSRFNFAQIKARPPAKGCKGSAENI